MYTLEKFWIVIGADDVHKRYTSKAAAMHMAENEARRQPGKQFVVMEAIAECRSADVLWQYAVFPKAVGRTDP